MNSWNDCLSELVTELARLGRSPDIYLRAGLSRADILDGFSKLHLHPPEELVKLYEWRDGSDTAAGSLEQISLFPDYHLLALKDGLRRYEEWLSNESEWEANDYWREFWFPVFDNGANNYLCVSCNPDSPDHGAVILVGTDEGPVVIYKHLVQMFKAVIECFRCGAYSVDEEGALIVDSEEERRIARELNEDVEYWNR